MLTLADLGNQFGALVIGFLAGVVVTVGAGWWFGYLKRKK